jgi:hypothetical protein
MGIQHLKNGYNQSKETKEQISSDIDSSRTMELQEKAINMVWTPPIIYIYNL